MPNPWPLVPLGEVLTERQEIPPLEPLIRGEIPIVAKVGFNDGQIQLRTTTQTKTGMILVRPGDLLVSGINAAKGAIAVYGIENEKPIAATIHYGAYIPNGERADVHYLWWLLRSRTFRELLTEYVPGGIKTELKAKRLLPVPMPLPPLDEQRRIVARIEQLAAKIQEARQMGHQAKGEAAAILDSALNAVWSHQGNWMTQPVSNLARTVSGQVDPRIEPYASLPHINGEAMESGTCRLLGYRLAKEDSVKSGKFHFMEGTVLYSKIRPYLRKAVQVPFEGVCSADVYAFDWINPELEPRFVMYSLVSPQFTEYANSLSGRTRMPKLNQNQLFAFQMSYPPLPDQRRIVAYLDGLQAKVDALKKLQAETAAELDALLPSILDKAFRGEL